MGCGLFCRSNFELPFIQNFPINMILVSTTFPPFNELQLLVQETPDVWTRSGTGGRIKKHDLASNVKLWLEDHPHAKVLHLTLRRAPLGHGSLHAQQLLEVARVVQSSAAPIKEILVDARDGHCLSIPVLCMLIDLLKPSSLRLHDIGLSLDCDPSMGELSYLIDQHVIHLEMMGVRHTRLGSKTDCTPLALHRFLCLS